MKPTGRSIRNFVDAVPFWQRPMLNISEAGEERQYASNFIHAYIMILVSRSPHIYSVDSILLIQDWDDFFCRSRCCAATISKLFAISVGASSLHSPLCSPSV